MKKQISKSEVLKILKEGYANIPDDVDITLEETGEVYVYCPGFQQPDWMDINGTYYMNPNATIEIYNFNEGPEQFEWELE